MIGYSKEQQIGSSKKKKQKDINADANKILKKIYKSKGITACELKLKDCWGSKWSSFAHKHKRIWYKNKPKLLSDFNQTILACVPCHQKIEHDKKLTNKMFKKLRP